MDPTNVVGSSKVVTETESNKVLRVPMARRGYGTRGNKVPIQTNHFKVKVNNVDGYFFHYSVALFYEDGQPVESKRGGREVVDRVRETYKRELGDKEFAYDGEKSLFTVGLVHFLVINSTSLLWSRMLHQLGMNMNIGNSNRDAKRLRRPSRCKTFKVEISFAAKIPMQAIANALRGQESHNSEALRVFDIILRQHAARQGCLLVRQSFFHDNKLYFADVGAGVLRCRGFHSSFRTTQSGLSLNMDVSTTMIIKPGSVIDFLLDNQNVRNRDDLFSIDWVKAKRSLRNLRITIISTKQEYKITGISEKPCREQLFTLKLRNNDDQTKEVTVYNYFVNHRKIDLPHSADLPCINAFDINNYGADPMLSSCGVSISSDFTEVEGRVLPTPVLKAAQGEDLFIRNGRWNFNNKKFVDPCRIEDWAVVIFSCPYGVTRLIRDLTRVGGAKGIAVEKPIGVFKENERYCRAPPLRKILCDVGAVTQCLAPTQVPNDQYLTKLGGVSSMLGGSLPIPMVLSSRQWPSISRYRASLRTQSPKLEMIDSLFKTQDDSIIELLLDFYNSSGQRKPDQIIIFRDGVSESQFNQVLNIELNQIIEACKFLDEKWSPKFVVLVAQKNHHTKFFKANSPDNVQPVAPIYYAHLAASQLEQWIKFDDGSETSSTHDGPVPVPVPPMPTLKENVRNTMFFC
ncbi:Argonaute family protein [Perilla frutescens var. frutescens]|nr:Argonaute family protein [Perilla frutescens var. frutescens]